MRIGTDVSGEWVPQYHHVKAFFSVNRICPARGTRCRTRSPGRGCTGGGGTTTPTCLLVRPECELSLAEIQTLATGIALTGGSLLLSDHLPNLPEDRLRLAASLLPPIDRRAAVLDWFDAQQPRRLRLDLTGPVGDWTLIAWINWEDVPRKVILNLSDYHLEDGAAYFARSYWSGEAFLVTGGETSGLEAAAHGVILLALRKASPKQAQYLGSGLHISQGLEVADWEMDEDCLRIGWNLPRSASGDGVFYLPRPPRETRLNGELVQIKSKGNGIYRCGVAFRRSAEMEIWFGDRGKS